jgi:nucleoid DNA-binding protein
MITKRNVAYYAKIIAKKHGLKQKDVQKLLTYGMKNVVKMIENGEDVRLMKLGHIYFDKKLYSKYKNTDKNRIFKDE